MKQFVVLCLAIISLSEGKDIPSHFKKCNKQSEDFSKCLTESANTGWPKYIQEDKSWTPILLDPIEEQIVNVAHGILTEGKISGLEKAHFMDIKVDLKKKAINIIFTSPVMSLTGNVDVHGNVLGLEVKETAPVNITFYDGIYNFRLRYDKFEKDNEQYLKIIKHELVYNIDRLNVDLKSSDRVRGARANKLFNDNWKVINVLSSSAISRIFSAAFAKKIEQLLGDISVNRLFDVQ